MRAVVTMPQSSRPSSATEVAGLVESVGPGVEGFAAGDRVMAATHFGGQAELAIALAGDSLRLDAHIPFEAGAAVLVNYGTACAAPRS